MRRLTSLLIGAGLLLLAGGLLLLGDQPVSSGDPTALEETLRPPTTTSAPPTTSLPSPAPNATTTPAIAGDPLPAAAEKPIADPVELRIEVLGVTAPIAAYGVDETGQMAVPDNVTEVGWYRFGPKPGEPGSAVLAAHVDMAGRGPGVFFELDTLVKGDLIAITYADGSEAQFRVAARSIYLKDELPLDVVFSRQGPPVLTLITCGGDFNRSSKRYDSNVVVYAVPVTGNEVPNGSSLSRDE